MQYSLYNKTASHHFYANTVKPNVNVQREKFLNRSEMNTNNSCQTNCLTCDVKLDVLKYFKVACTTYVPIVTAPKLDFTYCVA